MRHKRVSPSPRISPARFTGISRINVREKASKSRVKCLPLPSHGAVRVHTFRQSLHQALGRAQRISVRFAKASR